MHILISCFLNNEKSRLGIAHRITTKYLAFNIVKLFYLIDDLRIHDFDLSYRQYKLLSNNISKPSKNLKSFAKPGKLSFLNFKVGCKLLILKGRCRIKSGMTVSFIRFCKGLTY